MTNEKRSSFWGALTKFLTAAGGLAGVIAFMDWIGFSPTKILTHNQSSPTEAVLNLRQNMGYLRAREILLSGGWKPAEGSSDAEATGSDPSARFSMELPELQHCMPTGLGLCGGKLELEDGRSLIVSVSGSKEQPSLSGWEPSFYIPPSQSTLDAVNLLAPGLSYRKMEQSLLAAGWQSPIANPMHKASELPASELDFVKEFPNFKDCQINKDVLESCRFSFVTTGGRSLIITTDVIRNGSQYELLIRSWNLE